MDFLHEIWLKLNLDIMIIFFVVGSGFFQEKYMCHLVFSKDARLDASLKTLSLSFAISVAYLIILVLTSDGSVPMPWAKYFISYFAATSFYDLLIRPVRIAIRKKAKEKLNLTDEDLKDDPNKL